MSGMLESREATVEEAIQLVDTGRVLLAHPACDTGGGARRRRRWAYWRKADGTYWTRAGKIVRARILGPDTDTPIPVFYLEHDPKTDWSYR